jgi:hypothetical protein
MLPTTNISIPFLAPCARYFSICLFILAILKKRHIKYKHNNSPQY